MKAFKLDQLDMDIIEYPASDCSTTYNEISEKQGKIHGPFAINKKIRNI